MRIALVLASGMVSPLMAQDNDPLYATVAQTGIETIDTPDNVKLKLNKQFDDDEEEAAGGRSSDGINFQLLINLGKQIWDIIQKNKPQVNIQYDYANALPGGALSPAALAGFSPVQYKSFKIWGKNLYGAEVYSLKYTLVHRYGGHLDGRGKYLDAVAIVPQEVSVAWAYNLDFKVQKVSLVNIGTTEQPIASILLDGALKVSTYLQHYERRLMYEFRGDEGKILAIEKQ